MPKPSIARPRMMLCEVATTKPGRAAGLVAVEDDADLGVVAVDCRDRVGNGRDQSGVADRNSADGHRLNQDARGRLPR